MIRGILFLWFALASVARADNPSLVAARAAIEQVRYDDARGLLVEALRAGTNGPAEMREIYELSAATAVVLGQNDLAEQYYRRWLALEPDARLPTDASPRLRKPFVAAQAYTVAQHRLDARAERHGRRIEITVTSDPLGMVAAVTAIVDGERTPEVAVGTQPIAIEPTGTVSKIVLVDEHGNALRVIAAPAESPTAGEPPARPAHTPIVRRWVTWAIPALVLAGTGAGFLLAAQNAKGELDDLLATSPQHFFDEAEQARTRWKNDTMISTIAFAAAGGDRRQPRRRARRARHQLRWYDRHLAQPARPAQPTTLRPRGRRQPRWRARGTGSQL